MIALIAGAVFIILSTLTLFRPATFSEQLKAFPRNRTWGFILTAIGLLWSAYMINMMTLGEIGRFKWLLYILTPLSFYLIIQYLEELLAPRALGGLMMLAPVLMVDAARWHPSPWRYTIVILAYIMVIKGIWIMLCPFKFRTWTNAIFATEAKRKTAGIALAVCAVLLVITGIKAV